MSKKTFSVTIKGAPFSLTVPDHEIVEPESDMTISAEKAAELILQRGYVRWYDAGGDGRKPLGPGLPKVSYKEDV